MVRSTGSRKSVPEYSSQSPTITGSCSRASGKPLGSAPGWPGGGSMSKALSGASSGRKGSSAKRGSPFSGLFPFGQSESSWMAGSKRGTQIGYPDAVCMVVLVVSPLKRGSGLWGRPQRPIGSFIWMRTPLAAEHALTPAGFSAPPT